ncbi:MAG: peptide deformylase [Thermoleophilia bacterium]|nr:peptide deformylase [Thermoleophilia bacterium]
MAGEVREQALDPEREARRRAALLQIRQYGDPALKLRANDVSEFDEELARLAERMRLLMHEANGVGLAANQIGILRRMAVIHSGGEDGEPVAVVNPRVLERSEETAVDDEGCLSLQGVLLPVERAVGVTLEAHDVRGERLVLALEGLAARVAQHELDHLDGVLILDRTTPEARREALAVLRPRL